MTQIIQSWVVTIPFFFNCPRHIYIVISSNCYLQVDLHLLVFENNNILILLNIILSIIISVGMGSAFV